MSSDSSEGALPRAIVHKQILEVAEAQPEAPSATLAEDIPGATPDMVERTLDEYGDPAEAPPETGVESSPTNLPDPKHSVYPDPEDLTAGQREVLRAIRDNSDPTQRELAERLDISGSTVSNRVNAIDGFEWEKREAFAEGVFEQDTPQSTTTETDRATASDIDTNMKSNGTEQQPDEMEQVTDRLDEMERRMEELSRADDPPACFENPALVQKVAHACLKSDTITEDEELQILGSLLR